MRISPAIITICRIVVGLLFIFSGLIKANDPLGFSYKLEDYFTVFELDWAIPLSLLLSMIICIFEILLGITVLIGAYFVSTTWLLLFMIIFFTWLTGYSAITGAVTDCGCFGDAIKLTPTESFYKDLVLLVLIGALFMVRKEVQPLFNKKASTIMAAIGILFPALFTLHCYYHLPIKDFRPYKVGNNIVELMQIPDNAPQDVYETTLIYQNKTTGENKEFDVSNIPNDDQWEWKETKSVLIQEGYQSPIHDFNITNEDGDEFTEDILSKNQLNFMLISYDLNNSCYKAKDMIAQLTENCKKNNIEIIGLTASGEDQIKLFKEKTNVDFDFYFSDATALKTVVRSNPGLLLLKGGNVLAKWHYNDFPSFEEIEGKFL